jgi:hypothetical protein
VFVGAPPGFAKHSKPHSSSRRRWILCVLAGSLHRSPFTVSVAALKRRHAVFRSGIIEEFDEKQVKLLDLVHEKIIFYFFITFQRNEVRIAALLICGRQLETRWQNCDKTVILVPVLVSVAPRCFLKTLDVPTS